jgi:integrase
VPELPDDNNPVGRGREEKKRKIYDLRHVVAAQLVMVGCDLKTVQELLGHKTLTMALRYAHLTPGHKVNAVWILDLAFNVGINLTKTLQFERQ